MVDIPNTMQVNREVPKFDFSKQWGQTKDLLGRYSDKIGSMTSVPGLFNQYQDRFGIPQLREMATRYGEQASTLGNQIRALPRQMGERTRESLVTDAQRSRMVNAEQQPLMEQATQYGQLAEQAGSRLSQAEQLAMGMVNAEMAQQERSLLPFEKEFTANEQQQAREFAGYSFREQAELNRLLQNAQLGYQWTNAEKQRAHELSVKEVEYKNALGLLREEYTQRESLAGVTSLF